MHRFRALLGVVLVPCGVSLAVAVQPSAALASANWAPGIETTLPANANSSPGAFLFSVSCASAGNCGAIGDYNDSSNNVQGLLQSESAGTWATGVEATLPAGAAANPNESLNSVSCASTGNCTAVGAYNDSSSNVQGVLLSESSGTWATGVEATLPANAGTNPNVGLNSASCASAGNCTAVGTYSDSSGRAQGLLLSETSGTWATGVEATLPGNANTSPNVGLTSVSCASAGNCTAVGTYFDSSIHAQGLLLSESSGTWATGVEATLPANAGTNPNVRLKSVSCASPGNCTAVGSYADSSTNRQGLLLSQTSGTWATGVEATLPANAGPSPAVELRSVSCPSVGTCTATGHYTDSSTNHQGLLLSETSGTWATGVEATLPANAGPNPAVALFSVSCPSVGSCTAAGLYNDSSGNSQGLTISTVASPVLSVTAPASGTVGSAIAPASVAAALSSGASPTGTVTFSVFGPQSSPPGSCSSGGATVGSASVSGNGTYHPAAGFTPASPGDYWWYAGYSGDSANNSAASACGPGMAETVVPDTSAPSISITTPANGATYTQGQVVNASYSCTDPDGASDVASCASPVASGSPLDTSTTGTHNFTVNTADKAGNSASQTVSYTVVAPGGGGGSGGGGGGGSGGGTPTPTATTSGSPSTKAQGANVLVDPGIKVSCPAGGNPCTADETAVASVPASATTAKINKIVIGRRHFTIPAGKTKELTFKLNSRGARLLRKLKKLRVKITVTSHVDHNTPITTTKTITIKAPPRKHRH